MDKHTKCDPFAVITLGKSHKRTKTVKKTYAPEWGESFTLTYNESDATPSEVLIELWDEDVAKTKEYIGHVEISLAELMSDDFQVPPSSSPSPSSSPRRAPDPLPLRAAALSLRVAVPLRVLAPLRATLRLLASGALRASWHQSFSLAAGPSVRFLRRFTLAT
eukprot:1669528-Rhodomonas_salina.2